MGHDSTHPHESDVDGSDGDIRTHVTVGKRARSETPNESTNEGDESEAKRPHIVSQSDTLPLNGPARYLVVHKVQCSRRDDHDAHHPEAWFLDNPRLFRDDNKASTLRGKRVILGDIAVYLDGHPAISFVVTKSYSCDLYYKAHDRKFRTLMNAEQSSRVPRETRPYMFTLPKDGPRAVPSEETINNFRPELKWAMSAADEVLQGDHISHSAIFYDAEEFEAPFVEIYRNGDLLHRIASQYLDVDARFEIQSLLAYVTNAVQHDYKAADEHFAQGRVTKLHFDKLIRQNDIIVQVIGGDEIASMCEAYELEGRLSFELQCWNWKFDGFFRMEPSVIRIAWPEVENNEISISSLSAFPLRYADPRLKAKLKERGNMLWHCRHRKLISYMAPAPAFEVQMVNPRYMIDMGTYKTLHGTVDTRDDLGDTAMRKDEPPSDEFLILLPAKVPGFGLHNKRWVDLSVKHFAEVRWDKSAFDRLVLDHQKRELIKALVTVQIDTKAAPDIMEGKGNGLIILLHGAPGTGKTLTAETVAELAQKPLYRVTCGDIGYKPDLVEKYLESVLHIGTIWDCVVLLDEADVFLEERSPMDLKRNALVSVFLRVLEYYQGILILTTNRVGIFDEAFQSRIQLAMHYPVLGRSERGRIWSNFIQSLEGDVNREELKRECDQLEKHNLNGRQIRNTIKTAKQLAYYRKEALGLVHIDTAIKVAKDFNDYVQKVHGQTDEERAMQISTRWS